jgi:hypothetical protein
MILSSCFGQSTNNEIRRFVGTWRCQLKVSSIPATLTFTFNNDGSGNISVSARGNQDTVQIQYMIVSSKFIVKSEDGTDVCDYYFSQNGNVLVLGGLSLLGNSMAFWLDKQ